MGALCGTARPVIEPEQVPEQVPALALAPVPIFIVIDEPATVAVAVDSVDSVATDSAADSAAVASASESESASDSVPASDSIPDSVPASESAADSIADSIADSEPTTEKVPISAVEAYKGSVGLIEKQITPPNIA